MSLAISVNGTRHELDVDPHATLLDVLREELALTGAKEGCTEGECGACTVLVDGAAVDACLLVALSVEGAEIETVEGVSGDSGVLSPLQRELVDLGGVQCGFCTPGLVMSLTALLRESSSPSRAQIEETLAGNICRCTGYAQVIEAVEAAAAQKATP
jgi:carbon-monoxide dehydrogenase small subunit